MNHEDFTEVGFTPEQAAALVRAFEQLDRAARQYVRLRERIYLHWNPECQCYRNEQHKRHSH
jgi:hypothetical protein